MEDVNIKTVVQQDSSSYIAWVLEWYQWFCREIQQHGEAVSA